jgi:hypothetical protein
MLWDWLPGIDSRQRKNAFLFSVQSWSTLDPAKWVQQAVSRDPEPTPPSSSGVNDGGAVPAVSHVHSWCSAYYVAMNRDSFSFYTYPCTECKFLLILKLAESLLYFHFLYILLLKLLRRLKSKFVAIINLQAFLRSVLDGN